MSESEWQTICGLADVPDQGARDAEVQSGGQLLPIVVLRQAGRVYAYLNVCPHQGRMLNFAPNRFMVKEGAVMCSHHGATFRVTDGACLGGPCRGAPLRRFRTLVQDGRVLVDPARENSDA